MSTVPMDTDAASADPESPPAPHAHAFLRASFSDAPVAAAQLTADGAWSYVNDRMCALFGYLPHELMLIDPAALEHPDETSWKDLCACVRAGQPVNASTETRLIRGDGKLLWVHVIASEVRADASSPAETLVLLVDATGRKRHEQRLAAEYTVSQVVGEASSSGYRASEVLRAICSSLHWEIGLFWMPSEDDAFLRCAETWRGNNRAPALAEFDALSRARQVLRGEGAAGRTWASATTEMVPDLGAESAHGRAQEAVDASLNVSLAFPIFSGGRLYGVMEFFSRGAYAEDDFQELVNMIGVIGRELSASTTRMHAEAAAREGELRKTAIVDSALDCIISFDETGLITEFNQAAELTFGYLHDEVIGARMSDTVIPPRLRAKHIADVRRHLRTGETSMLRRRVETAGMRSDGREFPIELTMVRMPLSGPAVFTAFIRDISERNYARKELQESNERYKRLAELALEGIIVHETGVLVDANPSFLKMFGYDLDELKGKFVLDFLPAPESRSVVVSHAQSGFETPYEIVGMRKDGSTFPVELQGRPITFEGRSARVATVRDITERRDLEDQKQRVLLEQAARVQAEDQRRKMEFLAEASRVLGTSFDYNTTIAQLVRLAVPAFADWCLIDAMEDDGTFMCLGYAHSDPEKEKLLASRKHFVEKSVKSNHPTIQVLQTGTTQWAAEVPERATDAFASDDEHANALRALAPRSVIIVPLIVGERPFAAMTLAMSESGRRYDERDVALAETLARRAALAIQHARLYQQAQQATQARDEMLGVVAHDLRNPLNTIIMGAELLGEVMAERQTDLERRQLDILQRAAHRMNRMIQDLLDVRRMDTGGLVIDSRPESVRSLVQDALDMLSPLAAAGSIELRACGTEGLPHVVVDPARIQQVFSNLVGNAIKFTPADGLIEVCAETAGDEVQFSVIDTGPGIAAEQLPHVFRRFFQADKRDRRGIGLGLTIAQAIVEAHGGRIWVESWVGKGTAFRFTVPAVKP